MDTNRVLVGAISVICGGSLLAITVLAVINVKVPDSLTAAFGASLGALLALLRPPTGGHK